MMLKMPMMIEMIMMIKMVMNRMIKMTLIDRMPLGQISTYDPALQLQNKELQGSKNPKK